MREDTRTLTFAAIICITCSLLLSGTAAVLKSRQDANVAFDIQKNILKAFGEDIEGVTPESVSVIFENHIAELVLSTNGVPLEGVSVLDISKAELKEKSKRPLYIWTNDDGSKKYAFPISGKGLWSMLYGYLALEEDLETIAGITFYQHGETPGLGAKIVETSFQSQFAGKKLYKGAEKVNFVVAKPDPEDDGESEVDGISGATLTGKGVQALLNVEAANYSNYFNSIRGK